MTGDAHVRIAMLGTRGIPARYGGFETCVEEVSRRLVDAGHDVVVYCRTVPGEARRQRHRRYLGVRLIHLPALRVRVAETLSHTALSVVHLMFRRPDVAFAFNAANSPLLPLIRARRIPVITHVDGLEWKRAKWGPRGKQYYRAAESLAVRWSDGLIADALGIQDYYAEEFGAETQLISYGAPLIEAAQDDPLRELGLDPQGYHLVVARFEPENHVDVIVEAYVASRASRPLVVVGGAPYSDTYTSAIHAAADARVRFLGSVWDQTLLDQLYANAFTYVHGHSVGGTNPSLLRALGAGAPTIAYDVSFNREVLQSAGRYFDSRPALTTVLEQAEANPEETAGRGRQARQRASAYDWSDVAAKYEALAVRAPSLRSRARVSGKRSGAVETREGQTAERSDPRGAPS